MDVVSPTIIPVALLDCMDVADEVLEDRIVLMLGNQIIQIIEHVFDTKPALRLWEVVVVDPDDSNARVALTNGIEVLAHTGLLFPGLVREVVLPTEIPPITSQLSNPSNQDVHAAMMIQVGSPLFIQADRAFWVTLQPNVLASLLERQKMLAVVVLNAVIEQVDHLLDAGEIPGEPGVFYTLVSIAD